MENRIRKAIIPAAGLGTPDSSVIAVQRVPMEDVSHYGVVKSTVSQGGVHSVAHLVEKPRPEQAPSNLAIIGRYVLTPSIFDILSEQQPGAGGEIQLTDALDVLNQTHPLFAFEVKGTRYDVGDVAGFVKATIDLALADPSLRAQTWRYIQRVAEGSMRHEQPV